MHKVLEEKDVKAYSPLVLAYIGDAAFELAVRTHLAEAGNRKVKDLHHDTVSIVRAGSQAKLLSRIYDELTEDEQDIVRRGRNTKSHPPKNADVQQYRLSTGFEALLGYLWLKGDESRFLTLVEMALEESTE